MLKTLFIFIIFFAMVGCRGPARSPLTKAYIKNLFKNPPSNQIVLQEKTYKGCVYIPGSNPIQRLMVGSESTGETCSVTVGQENKVTVSFLGNRQISLVSTSGSSKWHSDIFAGDLGENQVLIIQHHQGQVFEVMQTVYDKNDHVVYGPSGKGTYIKGCRLGMTTSERLSGKMYCEK